MPLRLMLTAILFVSLLYSGACRAQFTDTTPYYINVNSNGSINSTNDGNSFVFSNNFRFSMSKKRVALNTNNSYLYGIQSGKLINNDFSTINDLNMFKSVRTVYYWGLLGLDKSISLQIDNRLQVGAGLGYHIFNRENLMVTITDGPIYEYNDLFNKEAYQTVRNSFRLKFFIVINGTTRLEGSTLVQNALNNQNDYIINSNTGFSFLFFKWIRFNTSLVYNRVNINARENLLLNFGVIYERYFQ